LPDETLNLKKLEPHDFFEKKLLSRLSIIGGQSFFLNS